MTKKDFLHSVIAGFCGTVTHWGLTTLRHWLDIQPGFEPYDVLQAFLARTAGSALPAGWAWVLTLINGALIWSSIFSWAYDRIPGKSALAKGIAVALFAWLIAGLVILPAIGLGPFAAAANAGARPAFLMLAMLTAYCLTLSHVYAWLRRGR